MAKQATIVLAIGLLLCFYGASAQVSGPIAAPSASAAPRTACLTALAASPYTSLNTLLQAAGLGPGLTDVIANGDGGITIFAPTNAALAGLPPAALTYLSAPENVDDLQALLLTHVVGQSLSAAELQAGTIISLSGEPLSLGAGLVPGNLTVDRIPVSAPDALAPADCYVHGISGVLVPSTLSPSAGLNTTTAPELLVVVPIVNATAPAPAPANATAPAPSPANATAPAPAPANATAPAPAPIAPAPVSALVNCSSLLTAAAAAGNYSQLVTALNGAGLTSGLGASSQPITVFAPNDAAFAALPATVRSALNANPTALRNVLAYHVATGYYPAATLLTLNGMSINSSAQGLPIPVMVSNSQVQVGYNQPPAVVNRADLALVNGSCALHGIDQIIIPPGFTLPAAPVAAPPLAASSATTGNTSATAGAPLAAVVGAGTGVVPTVGVLLASMLLGFLALLVV